ncbi:MAG: xanthine dehydrogenase accessory protein XdhC [Pseudomonadota bacterium]
MFNWPEQALRLLRDGEECIAVCIASVRGSAPRERGTTMLVTRHQLFGTIGGGKLEFDAITDARKRLADGSPAARRLLQQRIVLGSQRGQCCGGVVTLEYRYLSAADTDWLLQQQTTPALDVTVFGAGHVGKALAQVLSTMDARIVLVDNREAALDHRWPIQAFPFYAADPVAAVPHCPAGSQVLVMTHDHGLDLALCAALLKRRDLPFVGLIGSRTKARRFDKKLKAAGFDDAARERIVCPIGLHGVGSKHPGEIAVSVAAQLISERERMSRSDSLAGVA